MALPLKEGDLVVRPDYPDYLYAGRELRVQFDGEADDAVLRLKELAGILGSLPPATMLVPEPESDVNTSYGVQFGSVRVEIDWRTSAEISALLLERAAYHVQRSGVPSETIDLVLTDPFDVAV
jgi:hypothetical protein